MLSRDLARVKLDFDLILLLQHWSQQQISQCTTTALLELKIEGGTIMRGITVWSGMTAGTMAPLHGFVIKSKADNRGCTGKSEAGFVWKWYLLVLLRLQTHFLVKLHPNLLLSLWRPSLSPISKNRPIVF